MSDEGDQAIATALAVAHGSQSTRMHTGAIHGAAGGRTDVHNLTVPSNSYVLPADVVSSLPGAEGNTLAGHNLLDQLFKKAPYNSPTTSPYMSATAGPYGIEKRDTGGAMPDNGDRGIDIVGAAGEYVCTPQQVKIIGNGDIKHGHKVLDHFVLATRKANIATLRKLKPPVKDGSK